MSENIYDPVKDVYLKQPRVGDEAGKKGPTPLPGSHHVSASDDIEAKSPEETKAAAPKAEDIKAAEPKAEETKAEETKAEETKAGETKAEETKAGGTKVEEVKDHENIIESGERKPISVAKLGKIRKRKADERPEHSQVRRRSPSPSEADRRSSILPDKVVAKTATEDKLSPDVAEEPSSRPQKRPKARRDPIEAEKERQETIRRNDERDRLAREAANRRNQYHRGSEVVRSHYNDRPNQGRQERNASPIAKLRSFNNWVKATLIRRYTERRGLDVLDLGCGKGGDLQKWDKAQIASYTGIDLAEVSIEQASGRYRNMRNARFSAKFHAFDCFGLPLSQLLPPNRRIYDIVSMQFCLHYAFESEAKVRQMLSNVSESLPRGGKFLGTLPSSDALISHIEKLPKGKKDWGNSIYRIEFENDLPPGPDIVFRPAFGHRYTFYLKDAVDIVPEYVVPFNAFRALAEEYNLELLYSKGFHEVFDENCRTFDGGNLLDAMGVKKADGSQGIEGDEAEACGLYTAFCFEKRGAK